MAGEVRNPHIVRMDATWIREQLKRPGKTQRGLAATLGLDPAAISRILVGERKIQLHEVPKIRDYFANTMLSPEPPLQNVTPLTKVTPNNNNDLLEVMGMAEGGPDGWNLWNGDIIERIHRPDNLLDVPNAYAVYVVGRSMEPRYRHGEKAHIHPGKPVQPGDYVLVQRKPAHDGEPPLAVIKRLVRRTGAKLVLCQLNPEKEIEIPSSEVVSVHRIVGSSEA